jgi:biotin synthase
MTGLINEAEITHQLTKPQIVQLLTNESVNAELFAAADRVRQKYVGDAVHLRALIEFSNYCRQNCCYCGLRRDNDKVERYRLEPEMIIEFAKNAAGMGYKTVVLQSGEDMSFTVDKMVHIISEIKKLGVAITLSIGEKSYDEYKAYREAGADRYLLRIETTNRELYKKYDPGMDFDNRVRCLKDLKSLGYELGTGSLIGLPGQTFEDMADDILFFGEIGADMIGMGPFIANPDTPLAAAEGGTYTTSIKMLAIVRLLMPDINIPATTAMETLTPEGRLIALRSGANVVMPNVTDADHRSKYNLYPGKARLADSPFRSIDSVREKIESIGRFVSDDFGYRAGNK